MSEITYTLLSDGSSDRRLMPILTWLLREACPDVDIQSEWADLRQLQNPPRSLSDKIIKSVELYPCDLLFVHRDAETQSIDSRKEEIDYAVREASQSASSLPVICVIPVRMQEAWLLFDESAIRHASGNPNGRNSLVLPVLADVERLRDPKTRLEGALKTASELTGRRLKRFEVSKRAHLISLYINDFSPLRSLPAFQILEAELKSYISSSPAFQCN